MSDPNNYADDIEPDDDELECEFCGEHVDDCICDVDEDGCPND